MENEKIENESLYDSELIKICEYFCKKHEEVVKDYQKNYKDKFDQKDICTIKYGIGGELMHRGYFCPSPIEDMITGNAKRGRLSNKITDNYVYKYGFDKNDRLIYVEKVQEFIVKEYIWYDNNIQYGVISADTNGRVSFVTRCIYDNDKIQRYEFSSVYKNDLGEPISNRIEVEEYIYENNEIVQIWRYTYFIYKGMKCIGNKDIVNPIRNEDKKVIKVQLIRLRDNIIIDNGVIALPKYKQRII